LKTWKLDSMIAAVGDVGMPSVSRGDQRARERGVVGRLGPGHALDRAVAELLRVPGQPLLHGVGEERRHLGAARRHGTEGEADRGAAQPRLPGAPEVAPAQPARLPPATAKVVVVGREQLLLAAAAELRRHVERLADREEADRHEHDVDAVVELRQPEREARLAADLVDADAANQQAEEQRAEAAHERLSDERGDRGEGEQRQREVVRRLEAHREVGHRPGDERQQDDADRAGDERADRRGRERGSRAAALGHLETLDGGGHRRALARRVEQDRRRRPAVHPARVDAGEHDERPRRIAEVERQRQQQRDRERRTDPRQHADERAQRYAERREQQVLGLEHRAEAVDEVAEDVHG
jgi:hypothetical protein